MIDLKDPEIVAAFKTVQAVLAEHKLSTETDYDGLIVVTGPDSDQVPGRGRTLLGACRDFLRVNGARP